jgi:hypothetical protein
VLVKSGGIADHLMAWTSLFRLDQRDNDHMRLCSYVVVHDKGISPNPFGGICTLAAWTPNHQSINMQPGDWILGNSTMSTGNLLIYAMRISKILDLHTDFHDPRYQLKTASSVDWQRRGGDNIYFLDEAAQWRQGLGFFHTEPERRKQDTKCPRVFISDHLFYFGENAPTVPAEFGSLIHTRQGCRCKHDPAASNIPHQEIG